MRRVTLTAVVLLTVPTTNCIAQVTVGERVQAVCDSVVTVLQNWQPQNAPEFYATRPNQSAASSYMFVSYKGKAIPLPEHEDEWTFLMEDGLAALSGGIGDRTYVFGPASEGDNFKLLKSIVTRAGFPAIELSPLQRLKYAVSLNTEDVTCDHENPEKTILDYTSLIVKSFAFKEYSKVYEHNGGLLALSVESTGEHWRYVFDDPSSTDLYRVDIIHESSGRLGDIGFAIFTSDQSNFSDVPVWMKNFFDAINDPGVESYTKLLNSLDGMGMLDSTIESLKIAISEAAL